MWPTADPEIRSPVVLVRDRDRIYGNCLPKSPQPASEVRGGHLHAFEALRPEVNNMKRTVWFRAPRALDRASGINQGTGGRVGVRTQVGVSVWVGRGWGTHKAVQSHMC